MKKYIYPQNLKAKTLLWFWSARDFIILMILALIGIFIWAKAGTPTFLAVAIGFAIISFRLDQTTLLDYIVYALRFFLLSPQYFEWSRK